MLGVICCPQRPYLLTQLQSVERALAAALMLSDAIGHNFYPTPDELLYFRALHEGMEPTDADGEPNDHREFFKKEDYAYLVSEHTKACSSKRSELSGVRGIRGEFDRVAEFNLKNTPDEDKEAAEEWAERMRGKVICPVYVVNGVRVGICKSQCRSNCLLEASVHCRR